MIRSVTFPRLVAKSPEELQAVQELFCALGFAPSKEWHEGTNRGIEMTAPSGAVELIAAGEAPSVDVMVEVSDAEAAWQIAQKLQLAIQREIGDTPQGGRLFEITIKGLRIGFLTPAREADDTRGLEAALDGRGKRFALVVSRFNSFITERLLDGALRALRQSGAQAVDIDIVHVPGSFEIPIAARQLALTKRYNAIVCVGCLLRGDTLHYEVIANEVTRGVGQSAQETGVPHAFGVLTCDTLEQAIDRAGLKAGNKGFDAGLTAVEMACLQEAVAR